MSQTTRKHKTAGFIMRKLMSYLWVDDFGMRIRVFLALMFVVLSILLNISIPLIFREIINALSSCASQPGYYFSLIFIIYGFAWTLSKTITQLREITLARVLERGVRRMSSAIFDHLHTLSLRFHLERKTGAVATIISRVQRAFPDIFMELFIFLIPTIIEIIIAMGILWYFYSFFYGFMLCLILAVYIIISIVGIEWLAQAQKINNKKEEKLSTRIIDSLLNFETVKYFNNQEFEHEQCNELMKEVEDSATRKQVRSELVHLVQGIIMGIGLIILTWISGKSVLNGGMKVGDFSLINGFLIQFFYPLSYFGIILRHIRRGFTDMENALDLLDIKPEIVDKPDALTLTAQTVEVVFDHVQFGYSPSRPILKDVSFTIPAGKTVAIVGSTGSGKSTIARLLFRLFDVTGGRILVNGHDIRQVTQQSLQKLFGIVPQDTVLFNNTLYYNIAYGRPQAPTSEVERAIHLAHLDRLVSYLPAGVNTMVGERGLKLSGGEKQRVSIARVLVKNPKMYIFDEATSALDTRTEREIQKSIEEISFGSTTLIIAHRLSTVVNADTIIVLDEGRVAESGTHAQLLAMQGIYKRLWEQQLVDQE